MLLKPPSGALLHDPIWDALGDQVTCLTFAAQIPAHGLAAPGRLRDPVASLLQMKEFTRSTVAELMLHDGFLSTDNPKNGTIFLALSMGQSDCDWDMNEPDFHAWVNFDGIWYHRPRGLQTSMLGADGKVIRDPSNIESAGHYNHIVGCFDAPEEGTPYAVRLNLHMFQPVHTFG